MDAALNKLRFELDLERAFVNDHGQRSVSVVRTFFGIACLIVLVGSCTQIFAERADLETFVYVSLSAIVPTCALIILATFHRSFPRIYQPLITAGTLGIMWGILYVWYTYPNGGFLYYGSLAAALITPLIYTISRLRFYWAVFSAWVSMGIYLVYASRSGVFEGETIFQPIYVMMSNLFSMLAGYYMERAARRDFLLTRMLEEERNRTEAVLSSVVPDRIALRMKNEEEIIADLHEDVIVLFADIVDFTKFSTKRGPNQVVQALDRVFSELDVLAERFGLEKIKTIGDAYMVVAGLPDPKPDDSDRIIAFAWKMIEVLELDRENPFQMRIGIHSGPVVAGVIGKKRLVYDLWGDTVNTASRMESTGEPGVIQISEEFRNRIAGRYPVLDRGVVAIKGKGAMRTYSLLTEAPATEPSSPKTTSPAQ